MSRFVEGSDTMEGLCIGSDDPEKARAEIFNGRRCELDSASTAVSASGDRRR